jgi:hypothetical protein
MEILKNICLKYSLFSQHWTKSDFE